MNPKWQFFVIGYLMALPATILGLLTAVLYHRAGSFRWSDGCIECLSPKLKSQGWGGQTWGFLLIYADEHNRSHNGIRVHERVHVVQGFLLGPLFPIAYFAIYLSSRILGNGPHVAYYTNPFEAQAYRKDEQTEGKWGHVG